MKKSLLFLACLLILSSCDPHLITPYIEDALNPEYDSRGHMLICHKSDGDIWRMATIPVNSWKVHRDHGDISLGDLDGDGYVPDNECGYTGAKGMGDCDDEDALVNPEAGCAPQASMILECEHSPTNARIVFESKVDDLINFQVYWDEGATLSEFSLSITNGSCESCPRIGGIGRPHGIENVYQIRQLDMSQPVVIKWLHGYCGTDRSLVID